MAGTQDTVHTAGLATRIKQFRRRNRHRLNRLLSRLFGTSQPRQRPLAAETRRILVIRLNKRLGNILFLTPMLRTLAATLPAARIDVVIQDARQKALLESLPGVGRVWVQEKSLAATFRLLRTLRARRYDLAIDPSANSAGNRLALALSNARQRMGFATEDQWVRLTHAAGRRQSRHQARQAVELLTQSVSDRRWDTFDTLAVFPADTAHRAAAQYWDAALAGTRGDAPVIGFFTEATGKKKLPDDWWQRFRRDCEAYGPALRWLQVCPPGTADPERTDMAQVRIADLDVLAALLSRMDVFVAADSGPMHLAAAAGAPVVGLFQATSPIAYAPLGQDCVALAGDDLTPTHAARAAVRVLRSDKHSGAA